MGQITHFNPQIKHRCEQLKVSSLPYQPIGDRMLIKRIVDDKYGGKDGTIIKADKWKGNETRGLLCAAGLGALDYLISHGTLVGDVVWIAKYVDWEEGGWIFARTEELCGSEDLTIRIRGNSKVGGLYKDEPLTAEDVGGLVTIALDSEDKYIYRFGKEP
jgi:co-chaperonin GroES (HSP10)